MKKITFSLTIILAVFLASCCCSEYIQPKHSPGKKIDISRCYRGKTKYKVYPYRVNWNDFSLSEVTVYFNVEVPMVFKNGSNSKRVYYPYCSFYSPREKKYYKKWEKVVVPPHRVVKFTSYVSFTGTSVWGFDGTCIVYEKKP